MNSKNHHVLFGSAVTKWMQFLVSPGNTDIQRISKKVETSRNVSEEEDQSRVEEKMCEKAPTVVESNSSERWTSGTSSSSGARTTCT